MQTKLFERSKLKIKQLTERKHDLDVSIILPLNEVSVVSRNIDLVAQKIVSAKHNKSSIIMMLGGHVIKIYMDYIINKNIPKLITTIKESEIQKERINRAAWLRGDNSYAFFLDLLSKRSMLSLWYTTAIKWDSYSDGKLILRDLQEHGIEWVVNIGDGGKLLFIPIEEYARKAVKYDRYPKKVCFDYGFPEELTTIK